MRESKPSHHSDLRADITVVINGISSVSLATVSRPPLCEAHNSDDDLIWELDVAGVDAETPLKELP
jgi:hypothetical protein